MYMKKILFMCLIALGMMFTSCKTTKNYMSIPTYYEKTNALKEYYTDKGYMLVGTSSNSQQSLVSGGMLFYKNGVAPILYNNVIFKDTYKFKNNTGETLNFTLSYKIGDFTVYTNDDSYTDYEILYSDVCECEVSELQKYEELCKNKPLIDFNTVDKVDTIVIPDIFSTIITVVGITTATITSLYFIFGK